MKGSAIMVLLLGIGIFSLSMMETEFRPIALFGEGKEAITGSLFVIIGIYLLCFRRDDDDDDQSGGKDQ